jgi:hypothetical protein
MEDRKVKQILPGSWHQWEGLDIRKVNKRVNMENYYILIYENGKVRPVETILRGERGI